MAFYKCKFLIKVRVGLQIRKEAKFPQCRSSLRMSESENGREREREPEDGNGALKERRGGVGPLVTKELMRGESRAPRLPDMHNSV